MKSRPKKLVLFDIDGTLLHCGKIWYESFLSAVSRVLPGQSLPEVSFAGKTDKWIIREFLQTMAPHLSTVDRESLSESILCDYLTAVRDEKHARVRNEVRTCPGVLPLLDVLSLREDIYLSILTGNVREGADLKLWAADLDVHFRPELGAFGSDHWDRHELPGIAIKRTESETGNCFKAKDIVIIGDTVHDIRCGRSLDVKSIAVGTGPSSDESALKAEMPDFFFKDLTQTAEIVGAILS